MICDLPVTIQSKTGSFNNKMAKSHSQTHNSEHFFFFSNQLTNIIINLFFSFWVKNVFFIVLNSQFYEHNAHVSEYAKEQEKWLEARFEEGKRHRATYTFVFQHIPLFLHHYDEEKEYFNIRPELREEIIDKMKRVCLEDLKVRK